MSWSHCGTDSKGREIGYSISAVCDHPGCVKSIDRGLAYVCGLMHGSDEYSCERYFCGTHKRNVIETPKLQAIAVCDECFAAVKVDNHDRVEGHKYFGIAWRT